MEVTEQLRHFGLSASESSVYLFLLQNGLSTPPDVSQETGIARTNCYNVLDTLLEKNLIEERLEGKRKAYLARSPESIVQMLDLQRQAAVQLLPDLKALYAPLRNKPSISYYAGWDEIRAGLYQSFEAESVVGLGSFDVLAEKMPGLYTYYKDELAKRGITYEEITSGVPRETSVATELYKSFNLGTNEKLPTVIMIWKDSVAFITLDDPAFATIMRNKAITETFQLLFRVLKGS